MTSNEDNGTRAYYSTDLVPMFKELRTGSKHMPHISGGGRKTVDAAAAAKAAGRKRK